MRRFGRKALAVLGATAVIAALAVAVPSAASAAPWIDQLPQEEWPDTVTADALPTVQIGTGVVRTVKVSGNIAYAGGEFTRARPAGAAPGTNEVTRNNFLSFNVTTGQLLPWAPSFNAPVRDLAITPDGTKLIAVGNFTQVNGQTRNRIAVFNLATGELASLATTPDINGPVLSVAVTDTIAYVGGYFSAVNGEGSARIGAVRLTNGGIVAAFRARFDDAGGVRRSTIPDQQVMALTVNPDGTRLMAAGNFTQASYANANGTIAYSVPNGRNGNSQGYGIALFDTASAAAALPIPASTRVRNAGGNAWLFSLDSDGQNVYGTGGHWASSGTIEGSFAIRWADGGVEWIEDCHGDTYDIASVGDVLYTASHKHYCANSGGFPQVDQGGWTIYHSTAWTKTASGINTPDIYGYPDHPGIPHPQLLYWFPQTTIGDFTGTNQAVWTISGNDEYVVYGGEFPSVNGMAQQGLVRYTVRSNAPNQQGPRPSQEQEREAHAAGISFNTWWMPTIQNFIPGTLRVSFPTLFDRDDYNLTYRVYLNTQNQAGLVDEFNLSNPWWEVQRLRSVITGLEPGSTHRIRVVASDPSGNTFQSEWTDATVSTTPVSPYLEAVAQDDVRHLWRLGETSGSSVDLFGDSNMTLTGRMIRNQTGAISGDANRAIQFNDSLIASQNNGSGGSDKAFAGPNTFSIEAWFRTTTTSGGKLVGFGSSRTGSSSSYDRHIYMNNAGQLYFGVYPGSVQTVNTTQTYRDGQWHHVVATLSSQGMRLYVDGELRGQRADVTSAQAYQGYWRIANDNLGSWTGAPSSAQFEGSLDEVAIYNEALSADRVQAHYVAGTTGVLPNAAPTATIADPQINGLQVSFSGSGTDVDGTIASYDWTFGDGTSAVGPTASKTYTSAGTYTVTLTVTDDRGATGIATRQVTVAPIPNAEPTAAFSVATDGLAISVDGSDSSDSDGTIESYAWNFGDGSSGTGATASKTYTSAGTYTVTLTVTDNEGASNSVSRDVTVTPVPNVVPSASFTVSVDGLSVAVDASGSSDPDGSIESYEWDFGSGYAAGAVTASHVFAGSGTYAVKLRVTDDDGATAVAERSVTVSEPVEPGAGLLADDDFNRSVSNGWGTADLGGAWTLRGTASRFSVADGAGRITIPGSTVQTVYADLNSVSSTSTRVDAVFSVDSLVESQYVSVVGRRVGSDNYIARLRMQADGGVRLFVLQDGAASVTPALQVPLTIVPGEKYVLSMEVTGTAPTTIKAKVWKQSESEPGWQREGTNSFAGLQAPGAVSVFTYVPNVASGGGVAFDRITVTDPTLGGG